MKCNKCCNKIKEGEEIRDDKKYYCETCWKSDSWRRTGTTIMLGAAFILILILFAVFIWVIWKDSKSKKDD